MMTGARWHTLCRDKNLFMKEQPVRHVLLLISGCVKLTQVSPSGNEVILWLFGAGDVLGAIGVAHGGTHSCSAQVLIEGTALVWDYAKFEGFLSELPQLRANVGNILTGRLVELEERFREIATEQVGRRVASTLVRLVKRVGRYSTEGSEVTLSREELAQMTGTTLFTISRLISEWESKGIVLPRRGAVIVRDAARLLEEGCKLE
jgi:CRP/FNR family transcriptional regulator, nitrogen oxide reductase regulator